MSELLVARGLFKAYVSGQRRLEVLRGLDLEVGRGEALAVVGDSGVGKSTLLHLLGGLDRPDSGELLFEGKPVSAGDAADLADYRNRRVGFVFQFHHLLPEFDARENVAMPGWIGRIPKMQALESADRMLEELGLGARKKHFPSQLSGGEQQRVAIARALLPEPSLLLADEPTGNLDLETSERVFELMRQCHESRNLTSIIVTHNRDLAERCDRMIEMDSGETR
jgi:lipoprotein-releasing system ATP-binding protein